MSDINSLKLILSGESSLDSSSFIGPFENKEDSCKFFKSYGFDLTDPIESAELFGIFQEAMQFIKRYFLKSGNPDGLDFVIPNIFYTIIDVADLGLISSNNYTDEVTKEDTLWGSIILKVMHTILHTDKDLRYHYFTTIQTQIFDRFYKYLQRDENDKLYLSSDSDDEKIYLHNFETKSNKTRESTIIKLLHKKENVAEELFDRIGVRFITESKQDILKVINFLRENYVIITNNLKPSRTVNTIFNLEMFTSKESILSDEIYTSKITDETDNAHTSKEYRAVHFTSRQLIKYQNPFLKELNNIRQTASKEDGQLADAILNLQTKDIAQSIRFFYPFEVQITDLESHNINTEGEASHKEYKNSQLMSAMNRLFKPLLEI